MEIDQEALRKLQERGTSRIGGKGSVRRKVKKVRKTNDVETQRLETTLEKNRLMDFPGVTAVDFVYDNEVVHFAAPKVKINYQGNTTYIAGKGETQPIPEGGYKTRSMDTNFSLQQLEEIARSKGIKIDDLLGQIKQAVPQEDSKEKVLEDDGIPDVDSFKVKEEEEVKV